MTKRDEIQKERERLADIFADVEADQAELLEGLLDDAAFLRVENRHLRQLMEETGTVRVHPEHPTLQKPVEAAKQYRQNVNSYAVIIKTLNSVLVKASGGEEDAFGEWLKAKMGD